MKKTIVLSMAVILIAVSLVGCGSSPTPEATATVMPTETSTPMVEATPTQAISNWEVAYYVDDFGDKTKDAYIRGRFSGSFSNSATMGSNLEVIVYYEKQSGFKLRILEYGNNRARDIGNESFTFSTKINETISNYLSSDIKTNYEDDWVCSEEITAKWLPVLEANDYEISCAMQMTGANGTRKYLFTIDGVGFAEQLEVLNK